MSNHLDLLPPLVEKGRFGDLLESNETISTSMSPHGNSLAVFMTPHRIVVNPKDQSATYDEPMYFASYDVAPSSERRLFITDTAIIFNFLQNMLKSSKGREPSWLQSPDATALIRQRAIEYVNHTKECWIHASQPMDRPEGPLQFSSDHYRILYSCFSLFVLLYIPESEYEKAPVGEELMEWLNIHFIEPSTEEGDQLSSLDVPWEDESFWPYLTRAILRGLTKASIFFLNTLLRHPSQELQDLIPILIPLVETQPRLRNYKAERDFAYASRRWSDKVKALRVEMDRVPENLRFDDHENWWDSLSDIVGILEGRGEVIQRVAEELGADWKEVCCTWGVFVDTRFRREDLPEVVAEVIEQMPPDPTNMEDMFHSALFSDQPEQALRYAAQFDPWLAAHLADLMEALGLLEAEVNTESELSKRDEYVLSYADYLHSDPTLWRIIVPYMYSCDEIGKERGDSLLMRVPLRYQNSDPSEGSGPVNSIAKTVKEISSLCLEHQREYVRRAVCKVAAQLLARQKDYGLAVTYHISAEDWPGLGRVIDRVLDEYIQNGPAAFASHAAKFIHSLQELPSRTNTEGIFAHRLTFAVRYAQIHRLRAEGESHAAVSEIITLLREEVAPKSWWAVLLCDTVDLLQHGPVSLFSSSDVVLLLSRLEEIHIRTLQGCGDDYLNVLLRTINGGSEKDALDRLKTVRFALAKYFARCTIAGNNNDTSTILSQ
ncbi:hypothetical protein V5O48_012909 [Marasmius crinis-equi]|uniref:Nuclear pore complex protein Nup85 n=1 Tax=Marasmius crinis-equi TaxID=585013 RepID=A0ABR3F201_9AGAR